MGHTNQQDQPQHERKLDPGGQEQLAPKMRTDPDSQVRETEDASLQDESYAFEEDTPEDEEFRDEDEEVQERIDYDNDDDFVI